MFLPHSFFFQNSPQETIFSVNPVGLLKAVQVSGNIYNKLGEYK